MDCAVRPRPIPDPGGRYSIKSISERLHVRMSHQSAVDCTDGVAPHPRALPTKWYSCTASRQRSLGTEREGRRRIDVACVAGFLSGSYEPERAGRLRSRGGGKAAPALGTAPGDAAHRNEIGMLVAWFPCGPRSAGVTATRLPGGGRGRDAAQLGFERDRIDA